MTEPLTGEFGLTAAVLLVLIGGTCGAIGVWVLHFGQAILAESFTHALLPGLVVATLVGAGLGVGALGGVLLAWAVLMLLVRAPRTSLATGSSVGVTTLVATGALLATAGHGVPDFDALLFGDPLAASWRDVALALVFALAGAAVLVLIGGRFAALAFDPGAARALGVRTGIVSGVALALLAVSVSVAANTAGALLALALVTGPAYGASAIAARLRSALVISAAAGASCGLLGIYLSYYTGWPAGASVALVIAAWAAAASLAGRQSAGARIL